MELSVFDVFRTSILQLSNYKNNLYPEKFRYLLVNEVLNKKSHCAWFL